MFSRMLKLPDEVRARYDLSSLEIAIHAAAPCPVPVKEQMIEWWGPIIHEYYGATEGPGIHRLRQRGMAGASRAPSAGCCSGSCTCWTTTCSPVPRARPDEIWFKTATPFEYFNDPARTAEARSADGR